MNKLKQTVFIIFIVATAALVFQFTPNAASYASGGAKIDVNGDAIMPHYYAVALQKFVKESTGRVSAALYDIDGDGSLEAIAFDEGVASGYEHWADPAEGGRLAVFGLKKGAGSDAAMGAAAEIGLPEYGINIYEIYITEKRNIVLYDSFEGSMYAVYKYAGGALAEEALLVDGSYADTDHYSINGVECSGPEYSAACAEYEVDNIAILISCGKLAFEWGRADAAAIRDDAQKILAMKANSSVAANRQAPHTAPPAPPADDALTAKPTASRVLVDGKAVSFEAYSIDGYNFFKLRDLAYTLSGTKKQFDVHWDGGKNAVSIISGQPYTVVGSEMEGKGSGGKKPVPTDSKITLDSKNVSFTAYAIGGNNYFKLRDVGRALNFGVYWDEANDAVVIETGKPYSEPR